MWQQNCLTGSGQLCLLIGNLSNNDGDGYENVTLKLNLRCFKIYRAYSNSFNSWNVGKFFWSWILKKLSKFRKRKRKSLSCVHVLDKTWNKVLFRYSRAATAKKCTKNLMQLHNCCLANLNLLLFCRSRCLRRCRCLSYLINIKHLLVWLST